MLRRDENIRKRKDGRWEGRYIKNYVIYGKSKCVSVYGKSYLEVKQKLIAVASNIDLDADVHKNNSLLSACHKTKYDMSVRFLQRPILPACKSFWFLHLLIPVLPLHQSKIHFKTLFRLVARHDGDKSLTARIANQMKKDFENDDERGDISENV